MKAHEQSYRCSPTDVIVVDGEKFARLESRDWGVTLPADIREDPAVFRAWVEARNPNWKPVSEARGDAIRRILEAR